MKLFRFSIILQLRASFYRAVVGEVELFGLGTALKHVLSAVALALSGFLSVTPAQADPSYVNVCNQSGDEIRVAVAFRRGLALFSNTWGVSGYFVFAPNECAALLGGAMLTDALFYVNSRPFWGFVGQQDVIYSADRVAIQNGSASIGLWHVCVPEKGPFEYTSQWDKVDNCRSGHVTKPFSISVRKPADTIVNLVLR